MQIIDSYSVFPVQESNNDSDSWHDSMHSNKLWVFCLQVKQIMEEAVTKKFVHEDSSHIIALCSKYTFLFSYGHTHTHLELVEQQVTCCCFSIKDTAWRHSACDYAAASMES